MKKKNTGLIVLVVILVVAVISLSGFIVYDKVLSNNSKVKNENTKENNTEDTKSETINEIGRNKIIKKTEELIINIPMINKYDNKINDFNTIDNQDKLNLVIEYLTNKENKNPYDCFNNRTITPEFIEKEVFSEIFKNKITFENEIFYCYSDSECLMNWDKINNKYIYNALGMGFEKKEIYYSKLINFEINNDKYELTYIHLFDTVDEGGYYGDTLYNKYINNNDPYINFTNNEFDKMYEIYTKTGKTENEQIKESVIEKMENIDNYNEFPKYKYIVELDNNDNPKLVGYEFIDVK